MKKRFLLTAFIFLISGIPFQLLAQNQLNFGINQQMRFGENRKNVSQGRGIAITNTLLPMASGIGSVMLFENNTVQTIGAITTVYGLIMGPSTGNFYANDYTRGFLGLAVRGIGAYLMKNATAEIFGEAFAQSLNIDNKEVSLTDTKILIGEALVLGSIVYNIISTKASVEEYNESQGYNVRFASTEVGNQLVPVLTARINL